MTRHRNKLNPIERRKARKKLMDAKKKKQPRLRLQQKPLPLLRRLQKPHRSLLLKRQWRKHQKLERMPRTASSRSSRTSSVKRAKKSKNVRSRRKLSRRSLNRNRGTPSSWLGRTRKDRWWWAAWSLTCSTKSAMTDDVNWPQLIQLVSTWLISALDHQKMSSAIWLLIYSLLIND